MVVALETIAVLPVYLPVRVINISWKGPCEEDGASEQRTALELVVAGLRAQNRFVVVSATNDGVGGADTSCPNRFADAITVGGIDSRGWRTALPFAGGASSGTGVAVDFVAPGMAFPMLVCQSYPIPCANPPCSYPCQSPPCSQGITRCNAVFGTNVLSGTSFAAPMVSGAISLILARGIELGVVNPVTWQGLTWDQVYDLLRRGARDRVSWENLQSGDIHDIVNTGSGIYSGDTFYGWGLIDIEASLCWLETLYGPGCN